MRSAGGFSRRLFSACLALGGQPLVVCVDDAHWADAATLDWLGYLVHRMAGRPLLLVVAYRPDEAVPPSDAARRGMGEAGRVATGAFGAPDP